MKNRPDLVIFVADDLTWGDIGPNGSREIRTPNFDRLAKQGLRLTRAFAASPTCTPSRCALYTGLYPIRNGAHANHSWISEGIRTWPQYFHELGYRCVLAGKTHIGPREQFPFEYLENSNIMPLGKNAVLWTDLNTGAVDQLLATHDRATPLCLIVCSHSPHVYWLNNEGYDPDKLELPANLVDTAQTRADRVKYDTDVTHLDSQVGDVMNSLERHGYAGESLFMFTADQGAQWPFAKWNLYDLGLRNPMLVRWPGQIAPEKSTEAMVSLIDVMPTLLEIAGGTAPSELDGRSFLPVLLGRTDAFREEVFQTHTGDGQMNRSPMRGIRTGQFHYILNLRPDETYKTHIDRGLPGDGRDYWESWVQKAKTDPAAADMVRRYQHRPAEELYDVLSDSWEQRNIAGELSNASILARLREKLKDWRISQGEDLSRILMPEDGRSGPLLYAK